MKAPVRFGIALLSILALSACAAGSAAAGQAAANGALSMFFLGLWHGIIAPVTLLVEIFNRLAPHTLPWVCRVYETHQTAVEYDVGFFLGVTGSPLLVWRRISSVN